MPPARCVRLADIYLRTQNVKTPPYTRGRSMDLLYVFNRYFFENEYMHFGYWEDGLELKYLNLKRAQERYVEELFKLLPEDVETILDVGCGSGEMASQLIDRGSRVDCVCPPTILSRYATDKLGDRATLFECRFEDLDTDRKYDLIYFAESFQFVDMRKALNQCRRYGNKYILIADLFKKDMPEKGPIGGGHSYSEFRALVEETGLREIANVDITPWIGPGFDLETRTMEEFFRPLLMVINRILAIRNSFLVRLALFSNRKRLNRFKTRYMDNPDRNRDSFARYKTYRFMLFRLPD